VIYCETVVKIQQDAFTVENILKSFDFSIEKAPVNSFVVKRNLIDYKFSQTYIKCRPYWQKLD